MQRCLMVEKGQHQGSSPSLSEPNTRQEVFTGGRQDTKAPVKKSEAQSRVLAPTETLEFTTSDQGDLGLRLVPDYPFSLYPSPALHNTTVHIMILGNSTEKPIMNFSRERSIY